jgi:hypothetical protein
MESAVGAPSTMFPGNSALDDALMGVAATALEGEPEPMRLVATTEQEY